MWGDINIEKHRRRDEKSKEKLKVPNNKVQQPNVNQKTSSNLQAEESITKRIQPTWINSLIILKLSQWN